MKVKLKTLQCKGNCVIYMNIRTIILFALLSVLIIGCNNSDEIAEQERQIKEKVASDLMSKRWVNDTVRYNNVSKIQETRTLIFGVTSVSYEHVYDSVTNNKFYSETYEYIVDYTINKDGTKIFVSIPDGPLTLDYSTTKLSGVLGKSHLVFLPQAN